MSGDRKVPIVELVAVSTSQDPWERLAREKGMRLGTQAAGPIKPVKTRKRIDWARALRETQEDSI